MHRSELQHNIWVNWEWGSQFWYFGILVEGAIWERCGKLIVHARSFSGGVGWSSGSGPFAFIRLVDRIGSNSGFKSGVPFALQRNRLSLSIELLRLFSSGVIPATAVQRLAQAAHEDGWGRDNALAKRLRQAGSNGAHSGNIQRDIFTAARLSNITEVLSDPYVFQVPGADGALRTARCFLPHETLHSMVHRHVAQQ